MHYEYGEPFLKEKRDELCVFLKKHHLEYDQNIDFTVNIIENEMIIATGSLEKNILKCICVDQNKQGEGLSASIVSQLVTKAVNLGFEHLFLFSKPQNQTLFTNTGFYKIAQTKDILFMENKKNAVFQFVHTLKNPAFIKNIGSVVVNCNPFTNGHLFLIEKAASQCDFLYVFVVWEDKSFFSAQDRFNLVQKGCAHLKNVQVCSTGPYLISAATFPTYFIKEKTQAQILNCELDITVFAECVAKPLGITKRFAGSEPNDKVTNEYNKQMSIFLPRFGIDFVQIERKTQNQTAISASLVRSYLQKGDFDAILPLVPQTTFDFLKSFNKKVTE